MEAIFTTTGMQIKPFRPTKAGMILKARSVWMNATHQAKPVTAYVMKDDTSKRLVTYNCHKTWLEQNIPDIVISEMPPNHKEMVGHEFALNADVMPNEIQASAAQAILDNNFKTAFFNIPTGVGKTLLAIYLTSLLGCKGWAMCHRQMVLEQWVATMADKTTFDIKRIKVVKSSKDLSKMAFGEFPVEKYDFYLSTPMLLTSFAKNYGLDMLNEAMDACGIGVKFFDEARYNVGNIVKINALTNIERTYYLSADFGQPDPQTELLYKKMFNSVPIIRPRKERIKSDYYTVGVLVRYNTHPSFNEIEGCFGKFGFDRHKFMEYTLNEDAFYHAFTSVMDTIRKTEKDGNHKTLILCNLIEQVDFLRDWLIAYYEKTDPNYPQNIVRFHSEMPHEEKVAALEWGKIIVSTYQSMGVGVDVYGIRHVVSLVPVNGIEDNQAAGRARRLPNGEDCFYYIFVDDGFEYVKKKLPARIAYLQDEKLKKTVSIKYS